MAKQDMLVQIFADFGDAGGKGKISTGFPIAKNRILTARHGLYDDNGNVANTIGVRWYYLLDKFPDRDFKPATLIPCDIDDGLDVALLEFPFPSFVDYSNRLCSTNPALIFAWESEGFALAGKDDADRKPIPIGGETYTAADGAQILVLVEKGKVEVPEQWRGISGAPVFRSGSNEIMGVVVECPPNHEAIRLFATPMWKLMANAKFRSEVSGARELDWESIKSRLKQILSKPIELPKELARNLGRDADKSDNELVDSVIDVLIGTPANIFLKHCDTAVTNLAMHGQKDAVEKCKQLVSYVLPIVFDGPTVDAICASAHKGVCRANVGSKTVAEIVMAAKDVRNTCFLSDGQDKAPVGVYMLDSPAVVQGIDPIGWVNEFKEQIIRDFARLDELPHGQAADLSMAEKLKLAVADLNYYRDEKQTRYYFYHAPKNNDENTKLTQAIQELHAVLDGHVVFIECGSLDVTIKERREVHNPLKKILSAKVENTE